jgi:K+ transporter
MEGTERISRLFGPVMLVWFAAIALAGLREVAQRARRRAA